MPAPPNTLSSGLAQLIGETDKRVGAKRVKNNKKIKGNMWALNKNPAVWGVSISTRGCSMIKAPGLRPRVQLASLFCPQGGGGLGTIRDVAFSACLPHGRAWNGQAG